MHYSPEESSGYMIYRASRLLRYRAAQYFQENGYDISPEQWAILMQIHDKERPALSDLVEPAIGDHPNVTRLVSGLERMRFVTKETNPDDKRSNIVVVTSAGQKFIGKALPGLLERKEEAFAGLDRHDLEILTTILNTLISGLE